MNIELNRNDDAMKLTMNEWKQKLEKIMLGGGKKSIDRQHEKNKLTARERIAYLVDDMADFVELGSFAGYDMYAEYGGCPAAGTVAGIGYVSGQ